MLTRNLSYLHRMEEDEPAPSDDSFFFRAFNKYKSVAEDVLNTDFLQAMKEETLSPTNFGALSVQDAYYCYRAADTYQTVLCAIDQKTESDLYQLVKEKYDGYVEYNLTYSDIWRIPMASSVNPHDEFKEYAEHEHQTACSQHPIYTLVAMLPCYYLWNWFCSKLKPDMQESNVYLSWVEGSIGTNGSYKIGNFIESWKNAGKEFNEDLAFEIYGESMNYEKTIFEKAYDSDRKTTLLRGGIL